MRTFAIYLALYLVFGWLCWAWLALPSKRAKKPESVKYAIGLPRTLDALREKRAHEGEEYEEPESLRRQREAQDDVEDVEA